MRRGRDIQAPAAKQAVQSMLHSPPAEKGAAATSALAELLPIAGIFALTAVLGAIASEKGINREARLCY